MSIAVCQILPEFVVFRSNISLGYEANDEPSSIYYGQENGDT